MAHYYDLSEAAFRAWYDNWATVAVANTGTLGLGVEGAAAITTAKTNYATAVADYTAAHDAAKAATSTKNAAYETALGLVQQWSNQWQANPAVSDPLKLELGLNIHDTTPSPRPIYAISELSGTGNSVGTVRLRWNRNGNLPGCNFIVQSRPTGGEWSFLAVTSRTRLALVGQPLSATEFRVLVERRGILSEPSDPVVVFSEGGGSPELILLEDAA